MSSISSRLDAGSSAAPPLPALPPKPPKPPIPPTPPAPPCPPSAPKASNQSRKVFRSEILTQTYKGIDENTRPLVNLKVPEDEQYPLDQKQMTKLHARKRMLDTALTAAAFYKKARRSDGTIRNMRIRIRGAAVQIGQGCKDKENKGNDTQAAHSNAGSGIRHESPYLKEMKDECNITPLKEKHLRLMGANSPTMKRAKQLVSDPAEHGKLDKLLERIIRQRSLIQGSLLEMLTNDTIIFPVKVNHTDSCLERKIRPQLEGLYEKAARGEISPSELNAEYSKIIVEHFTKRIEELQQQIDLLKSKPTVSAQRLQELDKLIEYNQLELKGTQEFDFDRQFTKIDPVTQNLEPLNLDDWELFGESLLVPFDPLTLR